MNWFKIKTLEGMRCYTYAGGSPHTLEALVEQATQGKYVRLDHLVYSDRGKIKEWNEWDAREMPSVVINPKAIVAIMQFRADPRTLAGG